MQIIARSLSMVMDTRTPKRLAWSVLIFCTIIAKKAYQRLSILTNIVCKWRGSIVPIDDRYSAAITNQRSHAITRTRGSQKYPDNDPV